MFGRMHHLFQLETYLCLTKHSSRFEFEVIIYLDKLQTNFFDSISPNLTSQSYSTDAAMVQTRIIRPLYHNRGLQKPQLFRRIRTTLFMITIFFNDHRYSQQMLSFDTHSVGMYKKLNLPSLEVRRIRFWVTSLYFSSYLQQTFLFDTHIVGVY